MRTLALSMLLSFCACSGLQAPGAATPMMLREPISGDHVPSPAMVKCTRLGGTSEFRGGVAGQRSQHTMCRFGKALIEEWTLFWATTDHEFGAAAQAFLTHRSPTTLINGGNPAEKYCSSLGGTSVALHDPAGRRAVGCQFDDESMIEQWTLLRGPADEENRQLVALFR